MPLFKSKRRRKYSRSRQAEKYYCLFRLAFLATFLQTTQVAIASVELGEKAPAKIANTNSLIVQLGLGLFVVIALLLCIAWFVKKLGYVGFSLQKEIKIIESIALSHREKAVLIETHGKRILLGVAPGRVSSLAVFDRAAEPLENQFGDDAPLAEVFDKSSEEPLKHSSFSGFLKQVLAPGNAK